MRRSSRHYNVKTAPSHIEPVLSDKLPFSVQEAYKTLRTNVMLSVPGTGCKCIGITSSGPSEGKSTTSINLAIALSQIGKKVLLVDCDMRLPTAAVTLKIMAAPGLSDFLSGQTKIEHAVRSLERYDGLNVLPAGNIPPDPTGLLESRQVEHLFSAFRKIYDYVIVDLPPVTLVPDAVIISKYLDGFLLVVREKQSRHKYVQEMMKQMQIAETNILGVVVTGDITKNGYYKRKKD